MSKTAMVEGVDAGQGTTGAVSARGGERGRDLPTVRSAVYQEEGGRDLNEGEPAPRQEAHGGAWNRLWGPIRNRLLRLRGQNQAPSTTSESTAQPASVDKSGQDEQAQTDPAVREPAEVVSQPVSASDSGVRNAADGETSEAEKAGAKTNVSEVDADQTVGSAGLTATAAAEEQGRVNDPTKTSTDGESVDASRDASVPEEPAVRSDGDASVPEEPVAAVATVADQRDGQPAESTAAIGEEQAVQALRQLLADFSKVAEAQKLISSLGEYLASNDPAQRREIEEKLLGLIPEDKRTEVMEQLRSLAEYRDKASAESPSAAGDPSTAGKDAGADRVSGEADPARKSPEAIAAELEEIGELIDKLDRDIQDRFNNELISLFKAKDDAERAEAQARLLSLFKDKPELADKVSALLSDPAFKEFVETITATPLDVGDSVDGAGGPDVGTVDPAPVDSGDPYTHEAIMDALKKLKDEEVSDAEKARIKKGFDHKKLWRNVIYWTGGPVIGFLAIVMLLVLLHGTKGGQQ